MTARPTRKQQQAQTRGTLLESAMAVFARKGLSGGSIDDIAAEAGFTKGAFYANFSSKDALLLELLQEHFDARMVEIEAIAGTEGALDEQAERAGRDFLAALRGDPDWCRLFLEFASRAARHEPFREQFVARCDGICDRIAIILERRAEELGITPGVPPAQLAQMTFAMANGSAIQQLLDPATPEETFATMLRLFFAGVLGEATPR